LPIRGDLVEVREVEPIDVAQLVAGVEEPLLCDGEAAHDASTDLPKSER
jgi:hypothetical protein